MNVFKKRLFETSKHQNYGQMKVYRPQNLVPRVGFCVESESDVQNVEFRAPGAKKWKNRPPLWLEENGWSQFISWAQKRETTVF